MNAINTESLETERLLPDIARDFPAAATGPIDRVGMEGIDVPVLLPDGAGAPIRTPAVADAFVSLDRPHAKGIHMSRLFLQLQQILETEEVSPATLEKLLTGFVDSHADVSHSSHVALRCDYLVRVPSLATDHHGWKSYPIEIASHYANDEYRHELQTTVTYSSTCPCSAALSRELIRGRFLERFRDAGSKVDRGAVADWLASEDGMCATPHSQRSHAEVRVAIDRRFGLLPIAPLIRAIESSVGTPVQSAVKREDEQAFAALNAENLMFCEDAVRKVRRGLEDLAWVKDYRVHVRHEESLHPHDAVSALCKGVEGGFTV